MTPEAQRIAIAEACGWREERNINGAYYWRNETEIYGPEVMPVPDYLNDLNAMHEAEEKLHASFQQSEMFVHRIEQVVYKTKSSGIGIKFATINATAAQRAEALLRTIGKWQT
jgi:hypothetical protein